VRSPDPDALPTVADVLRAARRLEGVARATPLEPAVWMEAAGGPVHLKLETQQRTGSFKLRGALNAIASLSPAERARGVVTASAGNHGLGVALASRLLGVGATVFLPANAPEVKRRRIERYGASLRAVAGDYDGAHREALAHAAATGAVHLHAFSDPAVVAGQGTVGLEIFRALPETATLLVPVGGGGLIGGVGLVARALAPRARVVGVQSTETAAMHASLAAGALRSPPMGPTLCEGLSGEIDERSLRLARAVVDEMVLVPEAAIRGAVRDLFVEEGVVAEGSAAVAVAALRSDLVRPAHGPVVAVVTGANIDARRFASILSG
jgi:threonine dehydratase